MYKRLLILLALAVLAGASPAHATLTWCGDQGNGWDDDGPGGDAVAACDLNAIKTETDALDTLAAAALPKTGGTMTGDLTLSADSGEGLVGGGLASCSNGTTEKLLWNSTTHKFSCGTDQTGGGGGALDDLTDVTITSPATGATVIYNGSAWIDGQLDLADSDSHTGTLAVGNGGTGITSLGTGVATAMGSAVDTSGGLATFDGLTAPTAACFPLTDLSGSLPDSVVPIWFPGKAIHITGIRVWADDGSVALNFKKDGTDNILTSDCTPGAAAWHTCTGGFVSTRDAIGATNWVALDYTGINADSILDICFDHTVD